MTVIPFKAAAAEALIPKIEAAYAASVRSARTTIAHAVECGKLLLEAKAGVPHGYWLNWVEANLTIDERTARRFMRLARLGPELANRSSMTDLETITAALALFAEPKSERTQAARPTFTPADIIVPQSEERPAPTPQPTISLSQVAQTPNPYAYLSRPVIQQPSGGMQAEALRSLPQFRRLLRPLRPWHYRRRHPSPRAIPAHSRHEALPSVARELPPAPAGRREMSDQLDG